MKKTLLGLISEPFSWRANDRRMNEAMRAQDAADHKTLSSFDIFKIEFGEQLPDIISNHPEHAEREMQIISIHKDPHASKFSRALNSATAYGYVYGKRASFLGGRTEEDDETIKVNDADNPDKDILDHQIFMNDYISSKPGQGLMVLASVSFYKFLAKSMVGTPLSAAFAAVAYLNPLSSGFKNSLLGPLHMAFRSKASTLGHEHVHNLQKDERAGYDPYANNFQNALRHQLRTQSVKLPFNKSVSLRKIREIDNFFSEGMVKYFGSDVELQARLHTIITRAIEAKRWNALPASTEQLWQGHKEAGLKSPDAVSEHIDLYFSKFPERLLLPENAKSSSVYKQALRSLHYDALEVNTAYNAHYIEENQMYFWENTLPYMYGYLLEIYGDENGRAKMGFDKDEPPLKMLLSNEHNKPDYIARQALVPKGGKTPALIFSSF